MPFNVAFKRVKNKIRDFFSMRINSNIILIPIQNVFVQLLIKLQEINEFL